MKTARYTLLCIFFLSGCYNLTISYYKPLFSDGSEDDFEASIYLPNEVGLHVSIRGCDSEFMMLTPPVWVTSWSKNCSVVAYMVSSPSVNLDFKDYEFILRDAQNSDLEYTRLNHYYIEYEYDNGTDIEYRRGVQVDFLLKFLPKKLEMVVPDVVIEGEVYQIPNITFDYHQATTTRHILEQY